MTTRKKVDWVIDHRFDRRKCRHYINGLTSVLHCHHYATLYSQLADDAELFDGKTLLRQAAECAFHKVLTNYYTEHEVSFLQDRLVLAEDYWMLCGMGLLKFEKVGPMSASARMERSHVDEGWIKKWGNRDKPVNFFGQGFIAAVMAATFDLPVNSYGVREVQSIVSGADVSLFNAVRH